MVRTIVTIDEEKCDGCGLCIPNCHEGAIKIIDGKARLVSDSLCDGMGNCLGHCPQDAIHLIQREADQFDETAVLASGGSLEPQAGGSHQPVSGGFRSPAMSLPGFAGLAPTSSPHAGGCPGSRMIDRSATPKASSPQAPLTSGASELRQWPVQLHLVNPSAPYFQKADLVLAADCAAFAVGDFHQRFLKGKALAIACPKLDDGQQRYVEKIHQMVEQSGLNTITVVRMEVPCCSGLTALAQSAVSGAARKVPLKEVIVDLEGNVKAENWL